MLDARGADLVSSEDQRPNFSSNPEPDYSGRAQSATGPVQGMTGARPPAPAQGAGGAQPGASLSRQAQDPLINSVLADRYHILSILGQGGMGVVYKARQELLDRLVAIKMLKSEFISDDSSVKRFRYEAKAASRLNHPHVITVYDFGVAETGEPYIVMEYLLGMSLSEAIAKGQAMPVDRALSIFGQVCDALDHAHSQGMIHRDLKPGNIMLLNNQNQPDFVKVVDFGIAKLVGVTPSESQKLTQTGEIFGSPVYMSPEQCQGEELGQASDIYGMGIVMYETLAGRLPFMGSNIVETITQHLCTPPPPFAKVRPDLQIPPEVEAIVMKCLRKEPSVRYASMGELAYDIMQIVGPSMGFRSGLRPTEEFRRPSGEYPAASSPRTSGEMPAPGRPTGEFSQPRPTGEFSQPRPTGEFAQAPRMTGDFAAPQSRQGAYGGPQSSGQQAQPEGPPEQNIYSGNEFRPNPRRTSAMSYGGPDGVSGRSARMRPQYNEPVAGEGQPQSNPLVLILCCIVGVLIATTGAIIWAASNGYFSKQTTKEEPSAQAPKAPAQVVPTAPAHGPPIAQPPVPATKPVTAPPPQAVTTAASKPPARVTSTRPTTVRNADPDNKRKRPVRREPTSAPPVSTPVEEPVTPPPRHHFQGDEYSRWNDFRDMERRH